MGYAELIRKTDQVRDPRLIEAWMRSEYGTLDGLSPAEFEDGVRAAAIMVEADPAFSERLALSFGLHPREVA